MDASSSANNESSTPLVKLDLRELGINVDALHLLRAMRIRTHADESLLDAADDLDEAWEAVDEAYEEGFDTRTIENTLARADRGLRRAERSYGAGEQSSAIDLAKEVQEMIDDAFVDLDRVTGATGDRMEAIQAYTQAEDALDAAWDAYELYFGDNLAVGKLLDAAEDVLERAHQAFHERTYDVAASLSIETQELVMDAQEEMKE